MAFTNFDKSVFARVFSKNDYFTETWATNVYNKIKNSKLLPEYMPRVRDNKQSDLTYSDSPVFIENIKYSYGNCLSVDAGETLTLENEINLERNFEVSFEVLLPTGSFELNINGLINISYDETGTTTAGGATSYGVEIFGESGFVHVEDDEFHVFKLIRNNDYVFLYVDDVLEFSFIKAQVDTVISGALVTSVLNDIGISNLKILTFDRKKILHWWKLNTQEDGVFIDVGLNGYDFYSFWFSICYFFGYIVRFSKYFRLDSVDINFLKRFLDSKGINYRSDANYDTLLAMFYKWKEILQERATQKITLPSDSVSNYSLQGNVSYDLSAEIEEEQNLGEDFELGVNVLLSETVTYNLFDCLTVSKTGTDVVIGFSLIDGLSSIVFNVTHEVTEDICSIKIIKDSTLVTLYINDEYVEINPVITTPNPDFKFKELFSSFTGGGLDSMYIKFTDSNTAQEIRYYFNDIDTLFLNCVTRNPDYEARIFGLDSIGSYSLAELFATGEFTTENNFKEKELDGELLNLYEIDNSEVVLAPSGAMDLSWILGSVSPLGKQTYPIGGFNKLPNKFKEIKVLGDYPLRAQQASLDVDFGDIYFDDGVIRVDKFDTSYRELLRNSATYLNSWTVPCMAENSYEVSFRMKISIPEETTTAPETTTSVVTSGVNLDMIFSLVGTGGTVNAKTSNASSFFFNGYNFDKEGYYWVRGIIYGSGVALANKETGLSFDPDNTNHLKFSTVTDPNISIRLSMKENAGNKAVIELWDLQFRLLALPTTKVSIGSKNVLFLYGRNNSNRSLIEIEEQANKLIPYNANLVLI